MLRNPLLHKKSGFLKTSVRYSSELEPCVYLYISFFSPFLLFSSSCLNYPYKKNEILYS